MNYHIQVERARLLMQQGRFDLAEQSLRAAVALEPDNGLAYSYLALVVIEKKEYDSAEEFAKRGVSLSPDDPMAHYTLSVILRQRNRLRQAEASIDAAIEFDPTSSAFYAQKAAIKIEQKQWKDVVHATDLGLQFDPDDVDCTNLRAIALTKLGRRDEAGMTIRTALAAAPEEADTHANMGWTLLHGGEPRQAAEYFKEALRLEPDNEWAREGIVESLKARNIFYRWMLRYMLWISRFTMRTQLLVFVGIVIGIQLMIRLPDSGPLLIAGIVIGICYMLFAISFWIADPLFNLLLRFDRFGRLVLTNEQRADTNWMAAALVIVTVLISGPLQSGIRLSDVVNYILLLVATGVTLSVSREARRKLAAAITMGAFAVATWYWFRWYVDTGLPIDIHDPAVVDSILNSQPAEDDPVVIALGSFLQSQTQLRNIFTWAAVGMTWLSGTFHKTRR